MTDRSPIWPAHLHHLCIRTPQMEDMTHWYVDHLGLAAESLGQGQTLLKGAERNLVLEPGDEKGLAFAAYAVEDAGQVDRLEGYLTANGIARADRQSSVFSSDQVALEDPDGNAFVFGVPSQTPNGGDTMPGRLQHVGICSTQIDALISFFVDEIGFRVSDIVKKEDGATAACFLRSDHEHHDLALFAASSSRFDHQCYETTCWNDIRDWGDHFAERRTIIEWGAARHGAGNNLFIFVRDPDGNPVELSAELETRDYDAPPGQWKAEERTLNLWGSAWMRE